MMHVLKSYIQSDSNLIDAIQGKFKEQIIISIALDDIQYEDDYINQLELIRPYLSEISFLELLIQKNLMIKYNRENKIASYLANTFFSSESGNSSLKRVVFKDVFHSNNPKQAAGLYEQLLEFNYQQYVDWVFSFIGSINHIGELDLNINSKFINANNSSAFKKARVSRLQTYVDRETDILEILSNVQQNTLKFIKVHIKDNTVQPKELYELQYQLFSYLEKEQCSSMQEIIFYNVMDDMLAMPNMTNSFFQNIQTKTLNLLGIKHSCNNLDESSKKVSESDMKIEITTKFLESINSLKNLKKLVLNQYLLDILCMDTIKQFQTKQEMLQRSRSISLRQSFQDIPLSNSHQSSQIMEWNKQISQDGSHQFIRQYSQNQHEEVKQNQQNYQNNTPLSIRLSRDTSNLDVSKALSSVTNNTQNTQKSKKSLMTFRSHAIEGMVFQYSAKLESSRHIEKSIKSSQQISKKNSFFEMDEVIQSGNDLTERTIKNSKFLNGHVFHSDKKIQNDCFTPTKSKYSEINGENQQRPTFALNQVEQPNEDNLKKFDIDDIPFFDIDSDQPSTDETTTNQVINQGSFPLDSIEQQQPTPVFAEVQPEQIYQEKLKQLSSQKRSSFEIQTHKGSTPLLKHLSSKGSSFNIDSSIPHTDNQEEMESNISQTNQIKLQTSTISNQPPESQLEQIEIVSANKFTLSLKINQQNRGIAKQLSEFLSPKIKELQLSLNDYEDAYSQEYISSEVFTSNKLVIQWQYKLMRNPPLRSVETANLFNILREKHQSLTSLTLQLTNKKQFCPATCQALQDLIGSSNTLKTFNFETCMLPSQMEFYKFLVCIAKSSIRHIEINGPKFELLSDESYLINPWKTYLTNRLRSLTVIGQKYSIAVLNSFATWKMFRLNIVHLSPSPSLPLNIQRQIVSNQYLFGFSHKNLQPNNLAHICYDKIHIIIAQYTVFSQQYYSILTYSPEITFWDLFFD